MKVVSVLLLALFTISTLLEAKENYLERKNMLASGLDARRGNMLHLQDGCRPEHCQHPRLGAIYPAVLLRRQIRKPAPRGSGQSVVTLVVEPHSGRRPQRQSGHHIRLQEGRKHAVCQVYPYAMGHDGQACRGCDGAMDDAGGNGYQSQKQTDMPAHRHHLRRRHT